MTAPSIQSTYGPPIAVTASVAADGLAWVKLLPMGIITPRDGRGPWRLDGLDHARKVVADSLAAAGATDLVFDYDHQTVFAARQGVGGRAPAAGWIKGLEARADGIWAKVQWTPTAAASLERREYRYVSPFFYHEQGSGRVTRINNASLVNTPAIRELPAVAKDQSMNPDTQALDELRALFKLGADAAPDAIVEAARSAVTAATASADPTRFVPMEVFTQVTGELHKATRGVSAEAAAMAVDREITSGRLMPFLKDWGVALCTANKPAFDSFVEQTSGPLQALLKPHDFPAFKPSADPLEAEIARNLGLKA